MICPGCGAENPESAGFCSLCFHSFTGEPPGPAGFQPAPTSPEYAAPVPGPPASAFEPAASAFAAHPPAGAGPPPPPLATDDYGFSQLAPGQLKAVDVIPPPPPPLAPSESGFQPPPSQWGGAGPGSAYGQPPPPAAAAKRNAFASPLGKVLSIVVMVVFFAVGYFGTDYVLTKRQVTYDSGISDLTFQYPAGYKKLSASEMATVSGVSDVARYNEILLADSTSDDMEFFLGAGSVALAPEEWDSAKASIAQQFTGGTSDMSLATSGITMTAPTIADTTVGNASAMEIKFKMSSQGYEFDCRAVVISNRSTMYLLFFMTRGDPGDAEARVKKVLDSVEFNSPVT